MKALSLKIGVVVLALLAFAAMPRTASADSYTLNGNAIDAFSLGAGNTFSIEAPLGGFSLGLLLDQAFDVNFPTLSVDDLTTGKIFNFTNGTIASDILGLYGFGLDYDVTFAYTPANNGVPEPSSLLLLSAGLVALAFAGRKLRGAGSAAPAA
jgi:PEP-CTERM motif